MAATATALSIAATTPFPKAAIEACLRDELVEAIKIEASVKGITLPSAISDIVKAPVRLDSLVAVSILCAVEPIVGFELPDSVVQAGGYSSVDAALGHMLPRIEKLWMKRKGTMP